MAVLRHILTAFVPTVLWGTGKQYGTLRGRLAYRLKEQKRSRSKQNTLQIKGLMYGLSPLHSVQKNHRLVRLVDIHFVGSIPRLNAPCYFLFDYRGHRSLKYLMAPKLLTIHGQIQVGLIDFLRIGQSINNKSEIGCMTRQRVIDGCNR